jgi:hypothetical protein
MAISKMNAEAAVKALNGCKAGEMFDKIKGNQHSMEKHFSKQSAQTGAVGGEPQGYFKRVKQVSFASKADLERTGIKEKTVERALAAVGADKARDFGKRLGRKGPISVPEKSAASKDDILGLVSSVLSSAACKLRRNNTNVETRFLAVSPMPDGFYGRAIDGDGVKSKDGDKSKDCNNAVVVIDAGRASTPQIITIFPADDTYVNARPLLT